MAKLAHVLVSVLLTVVALGLWVLLESALVAFGWYLHGQNPGILHSWTRFFLEHRNCLFFPPVFSMVWIAFIWRRPAVTLDSAFIYFLIVAILSVVLYVLVGVAMIHARMIDIM